MQAEKLWITAVLGAVVYVLMKQWRPELAPLALLAAVAVIAGLCLQGLQSVLNGASEVLQQTESAAFLQILIKCTALCVMAKVCGDACRDSGALALATAVETGGRLCALGLAMPLFRAVAALAVSLCR